MYDMAYMHDIIDYIAYLMPTLYNYSQMPNNIQPANAPPIPSNQKELQEWFNFIEGAMGIQIRNKKREMDRTKGIVNHILKSNPKRD